MHLPYTYQVCIDGLTQYLGKCLRLLLALLLACAYSGSHSQTCAASPNGVVAWWPMDDTAGTSVEEIVGSNHGIRIGSVAPAPGLVAGSLRFGGNQSYVGVPDNDAWAFGTRSFTIELWVNWDSIAIGSVGHPGTIFIGSSEGAGNRNKWFLAYGGGFLNFHLNSPTLGPRFFPLVPFNPTVQEWYHIALTRRDGVYTIYINGVASGVAVEDSAVPNADIALTIGQAESLGFMSGRLDEITVFDRALDSSEIQAIAAAGAAGKCKTFRIATNNLPLAQLGRPLDTSLRAQFAQDPVTWSLAAGRLPSGLLLDSSGRIAGVPSEAGNFPIVVHATDSAGRVAESSLVQTVTLIAAPPTLQTRISGTVPVPGRSVEYFISVENTGTADALAVEVLAPLPPELRLISVVPAGTVDTPTLVGASVAHWVVPEIRVGDSVVLSYTASVEPSTRIGGQLVVEVFARAGDPASARSRGFQKRSERGAGQTFAARGSLFATTPETLQFQWMECSASAALTAISCADCVVPCTNAVRVCATALLPACLVASAICTHCMLRPDPTGTCLESIWSVLTSCGRALRNTAQTAYAVYARDVAGAIDPNEKLVNHAKYVRSGQLLVYPVWFENVGNIEARDVFISDTIDSSLDISTLSLPGPAGSVDATARTVQWALLGRNLMPGESDHVLFSIRTLRGLPSGTVIRNKATIRFEVFEPFTTNEVVNVIDDVRPHCRLKPLPRVSKGSRLELSWNGFDLIGEVESYSVWMAKDGAAFVGIVEDSRANTIALNLDVGHRYDFVCVARDTAGNVEIKPLIGEVTTFIGPSSAVKR